ncbi:hypothetical protein FB451DRAFT_1410944 [Mycena latifolia]|nr:hypothetical protein FB451DRAFT_1410944 [Mycena latifolia]
MNSCTASENFFKALNAEDKRLVLYPDAFHDLMTEPGIKDQYPEDCIAWAEAHLHHPASPLAKLVGSRPELQPPLWAIPDGAQNLKVSDIAGAKCLSPYLCGIFYIEIALLTNTSPMAPLHHLPTARDVDNASASATTTDSAVPDPSSSTTLFGAPPPYLFPSWVGFLGLALFVCMLLATLYWVYRQSGPKGDQQPVAPQVTKPILGRHFSKRASSSPESLAKARAQVPKPTIALPPPAYTAAADNAAPGSEDDIFRRYTVINTANNLRRPVQVVEKPLMVEAVRPQVGSRW